MPARIVGQGFGLVAVIYILVVGYFMYMAGKISASLSKIATTLEQMRMEQTMRRPEN